MTTTLMRTRLEPLRILGTRVQTGTKETALRAIERSSDAERPTSVTFANAHTLNVAYADPEYRRTLDQFAFVLNDGSGVALAARRQGRELPANLNGSDFTPLILSMCARRDWPVYFVGAKPGVGERAAQELRRQIPGLQIAGVTNGYFDPDDTESVLETIRESGAQVLLCAMGNPLQERWLEAHLDATGVRLGVGVGAFLDFAAGEKTRAPHVFNAMGVEWAFRLAIEPRRMWRRYVVGNPKFVLRVMRDGYTSTVTPASTTLPGGIRVERRNVERRALQLAA